MEDEWSNLSAVESHPEVLSGAFVFRGTRVPIAALFENMRTGASVDEFLEWFPGVQRTDARAVLLFADATISRDMPRHFFWRCSHLDHESAIRADIARQNYSVMPRHWYVDATVKCARCSESFCFTALEQKYWYEELGFYVDSFARNCTKCRKDELRQKELRQEYDRAIENALRSDSAEEKQRIANVIDELCVFEGAVPAKIHENRKRLGEQLSRIENSKVN